jgi:uncharacterized Zn-binding protein involved in type VI secretion
MPLPEARLGDLHTCPILGHAVTPIITGCATVFANGKPVATIGHMTACGAVIVTGDSTVLAEGKPVARLGDKTSHGGVIISGSEDVFVGTSVQSSVLKKATVTALAFVEFCPAAGGT